MNAVSSMPDRAASGLVRITRLALPVAAVALLMGIAAAPGYRFGWWHFSTSFSLLRWGLWVAGAGALLCVIAAIISVRRRAWASVFVHTVAIAGCSLLIAAVLQMRAQAGAVPPIYDISTDLDNPPAFEAVADLRGEHANPIAYPGAEVAAQQRLAYPDLISLQIVDSPASAFSAALDAANEMGWEVIAVQAARGRIEAVATTPWFGFRDDVVIRVAASQRGSVVDVRSKSRVVHSDLGANAARIRVFIDKMKRRTQAQ